jgi:putative endonuclease
MADYWVYILTNQPRSTLYVGVTNDLVRRAHEHHEGLVNGFTKRYKLKMLVYFERFDSPQAAIQREKNIKHWSRAWKLQLVELTNPQWRDYLTTSLADFPPSLPGLTRNVWRDWHMARMEYLYRRQFCFNSSSNHASASAS